MKKTALLLLAAAMLATPLTGCGGKSYTDGTYEGKSEIHTDSEDGNGDGYGVVKLTIKDNIVTECEFKTYQPDGTLKDEDYGKQNGEVANADFYNKAQKAVLASAKYGEELAKKGDIKEVDAISGATISHSEFKEAVADALAKAEK